MEQRIVGLAVSTVRTQPVTILRLLASGAPVKSVLVRLQVTLSVAHLDVMPVDAIAIKFATYFRTVALTFKSYVLLYVSYNHFVTQKWQFQ